MSAMKSVLGALFLSAISLTSTPAPVFAADPTYGDYTDVDCGRPDVVKHIQKRFRYQVANVPNLPQVDIVQISDIRENRYLPAEEDRPIARRYCIGTANLSDGANREIWYLIEYKMGFATINSRGLISSRLVQPDNIEFCVSGFDRWMVYNGACRVLR